MNRRIVSAVLVMAGTGTLAGCGSVAVPQSHATQRTPRATLKHNDVNIGLALNPQWIMPDRLPLTAQTKYERLAWPVYNTQLPMNRFPTSWHGNDLVNTWKLPPNWVPYLFKNEERAPTLGDLGTEKIPLTLYITLQGTVFLYPQTISANQWPASPTVGNIPPATIVAEFVPLKAAVKAGIIPESDNQPWTLGSKVGGHAWQKALGMTSTQISAAIQP